jgi:hypothetical protein
MQRSNQRIHGSATSYFFLSKSTLLETIPMTQTVELRVSYRYLKEHSWVVQGITGFLSAYFMERPGFQVKKHFDELETGMHVWVCDIPPDMKFRFLLRRLKEDIPPCQYQQLETDETKCPRYLLDSLDTETK